MYFSHSPRSAFVAACCAYGIAVLSAASPASSHPHVFIENHAEADFVSGQLAGFGLRWRFDALFTTGVLSLTHRAKIGGPLTDTEAASIKAHFFDNLVHYGYFVHVWQGGKTIPVSRIESFKATLDGDKLVYQFFARLATPLDVRTAPVTADFYDETYFVDVSFPDADPQAIVMHDSPVGCTATIQDDHAHVIPFWGVDPQGVDLSCK